MKRSKKMMLSVMPLTCLLSGQIATEAVAQDNNSCTPDREQKLLDNGNTAACGTTQIARFSLQQAVLINSISVWYNTNIGGRELKFTLSGPVSLNGTMQAVSCDPYQSQWCVGEIKLGQKFMPGDYVITTEQDAVCQNTGSGGNGFVTLKGCINSSEKKNAENSQPVKSTNGIPCKEGEHASKNPFGEDICIKIKDLKTGPVHNMNE